MGPVLTCEPITCNYDEPIMYKYRPHNGASLYGAPNSFAAWRILQVKSTVTRQLPTPTPYHPTQDWFVLWCSQWLCRPAYTASLKARQSPLKELVYSPDMCTWISAPSEEIAQPPSLLYVLHSKAIGCHDMSTCSHAASYAAASKKPKDASANHRPLAGVGLCSVGYVKNSTKHIVNVLFSVHQVPFKTRTQVIQGVVTSTFTRPRLSY